MKDKDIRCFIIANKMPSKANEWWPIWREWRHNLAPWEQQPNSRTSNKLLQISKVVIIGSELLRPLASKVLVYLLFSTSPVSCLLAFFPAFFLVFLYFNFFLLLRTQTYLFNLGLLIYLLVWFLVKPCGAQSPVDYELRGHSRRCTGDNGSNGWQPHAKHHFNHSTLFLALGLFVFLPLLVIIWAVFCSWYLPCQVFWKHLQRNPVISPHRIASYWFPSYWLPNVLCVLWLKPSLILEDSVAQVQRIFFIFLLFNSISAGHPKISLSFFAMEGHYLWFYFQICKVFFQTNGKFSQFATYLFPFVSGFQNALYYIRHGHEIDLLFYSKLKKKKKPVHMERN